MPSPPAQYPSQVIYLTTPEEKRELRAWAARRGVSVSIVVRELVEAGLIARRAAWERAYGRLTHRELYPHGERRVRTRAEGAE